MPYPRCFVAKLPFAANGSNRLLSMTTSGAIFVGMTNERGLYRLPFGSFAILYMRLPNPEITGV